MPHRGASADDKTAANSDWLAVNVEKIHERTAQSSADKPSRWSIHWVRFNEGKLEHKTTEYIAEHVPHNDGADRLHSRKQAYPSGGMGSFKRLYKRGAEPLGLKSLNAHLKGRSESLQLTPQQADRCQMLSYAYGRQLLAFERCNHRGITKAGILKTILGDGVDLHGVVARDGKVEVNERVLTEIMVKLLARLQFYHDKFDRVMLDIKPENLMPIFSRDGVIKDMQFIDLDDAVIDRVIYTASVLDADLKRYLKDQLDDKRSALGVVSEAKMDERAILKTLSRSVDHRLLCNALNVSFSLRGDDTGDFERLFAQLFYSEPGATKSMQGLVADAFAGSDHCSHYQDLYDSAYSMCERRWQQAGQLQQAWRKEQRIDSPVSAGAGFGAGAGSSSTTLSVATGVDDRVDIETHCLATIENFTQKHQVIRKDAGLFGHASVAGSQTIPSVQVAHLLHCWLQGTDELSQAQREALRWVSQPENEGRLVAALGGNLLKPLVEQIQRAKAINSQQLQDLLVGYIGNKIFGSIEQLDEDSCANVTIGCGNE